MERFPQRESSSLHIPPALAETAYGKYITDFIVPALEEQRRIPQKIKTLLKELIGGNAEKEITHQLSILEGFLRTPIIFDSLKDDDRERVRDELMRTPELYEYYKNNPLRMNKIAEVIDAIDGLLNYAQPVLKKISFGNLKPVPNILLTQTVDTWKKIKMREPAITVEQHNAMKEHFVLGLLTVLAQLVFDAAIFALNNNKAIATLPTGELSPDMLAIVEARAKGVANKQKNKT